MQNPVILCKERDNPNSIFKVESLLSLPLGETSFFPLNTYSTVRQPLWTTRRQNSAASSTWGSIKITLLKYCMLDSNSLRLFCKVIVVIAELHVNLPLLANLKVKLRPKPTRWYIPVTRSRTTVYLKNSYKVCSCCVLNVQ
jgi:hypothetical protein